MATEDDDLDLYNFDDDDDEGDQEEASEPQASSSSAGPPKKKETAGEREARLEREKDALMVKSREPPPSVPPTATSTNPTDPQSTSFDPLRALYDPEEAVPALDKDKAKCYDNVEKFVAVYEGKVKKKEAKKASEEAKANREPLTRQFLPEQMAVKGTRKEKPNLLRWMEALRAKKEASPLKALSEAREWRCKVRVFVRGRSHLRGHCTGFLVAFDKHWDGLSRCRHPP